MTRNYKIAEEIANEIVKVNNAKYEAVKKRDIESFIKFDDLQYNLEESLVSFGYETTLVYEEGSPMMYYQGRELKKSKGGVILPTK